MASVVFVGVMMGFLAIANVFTPPGVPGAPSPVGAGSKRRVLNDIVRAAVVRGKEVPPGKYGWLVTINDTCGGFMVGPNIAVTAAHCDMPIWTVRRGTYDLANATGTAERRVLAFVSHPSFSRIDMDTKNDVRVMLLDDEHGDAVPTLAIANSTTPPAVLTIVGMGDTDDHGAKDSRVTEANVSVSVCTHCPECLCSGADPTMGSPCFGDSGGPLFDPATRIVYGIVSSGPLLCTMGAHYTSLAYQAPFVAQAQATLAKYRNEPDRLKVCVKMFTVYRRIVLEDVVPVCELRTCAMPIPPTKYPHAVYVGGTWFACRCRGLPNQTFTYRFSWSRKFPTTVLRASRAEISVACPSCVPMNTVVYITALGTLFIAAT